MDDHSFRLGDHGRYTASTHFGLWFPEPLLVIPYVAALWEPRAADEFYVVLLSLPANQLFAAPRTWLPRISVVSLLQ